jgi:lysophospholipase L1-like esterase
MIHPKKITDHAGETPGMKINKPNDGRCTRNPPGVPPQRTRFLAFLAVAALVLSLAGCQSQAAALRADDAQTILVYGDSITWGYVPLPDVPAPERYPFSVRWTGVLQRELGPGYAVIEEGLNARTAGVDSFSALDPAIQNGLNLNGAPSFLPILRTHEPLDLVVIFLGANDARPANKQSLDDIKQSITQLIRLAKLGARIRPPKILLIGPPPLGPGQNSGLNGAFGGGYELSAALAAAYRDVARTEGVEFFDAGAVASVRDSIDGIHFDAENNRKFGTALAARIREILP